MKLAVVANFAYGAMTSNPQLHVGGVERQVSILCKWMASRGHEVSLITWDEGYEEGEVIDGVKLIKLCRQDAGIPGLRFFYPRWTSLVRALRMADADVYYQNCAEYVTGQVAMWCKLNRRRFVYSVASEPDCDPSLPTMSKIRDRILYKYGIYNSNKIIVQNIKQKKMIQEGFGQTATVMNMACEGPSDMEYATPTPPAKSSTNVIWVGRIARVKRPDRIFEIASRLENCTFLVVGGADKDAEYANEVFSTAKKYANVTMYGSMNQEELRKLYARSSILCCTSEYEGLPNTFLEAWSYGLPIVSTVDPDDVLSKNLLGVHCKNTDDICNVISNFVNDEKKWIEYSRRSREYYKHNHSLDSTMRNFEIMFESLE